MNRDEIALLLPAVFRSTLSPDPAAPDLLISLLAVMERQHAPDPALLRELGLPMTAEQPSGLPLSGLMPAVDGPRYLGWDYLFDRLDILLDAEQTAERFLPFLARWTGLENLLLALVEDAQAGYAALSHSSFAAPRPRRWQEIIRWLKHPACPLDLPRLRQLIIAAPELIRLRGTRRGLIRYLEMATGLNGAFDVRNDLQRPFHILVAVPELTAPRLVLVRHIIELEKPAYVTYELKLPVGDKR